MRGIKTKTKESDWTKEHLQKLFAAMKSRIPEASRMHAYSATQRTLDWKKVAFFPFSPEACYEKWREILNKMRKTRTLTELIVEAEDALSSPVKDKMFPQQRPKKAMTPNAIFIKENLSKYQEQFPNMRTQKVFQMLMTKYRKLPDEDKAPYLEKHRLATEEYHKEMAKFRKQCEKQPDQKRKRVSSDTENQDKQCDDGEEEVLPTKPPPNGYNLFCKEQHASLAGTTSKFSLNVWGESWRALTDRQRDNYNARCRELQSQYGFKLKTHLMSLDKEEQKWFIEKHGIKQRKLRKRLLGEPKMPARSGTSLHSSDQMKLMKTEFPNPRERLARANRKWNDLSCIEKERYKEEVNKNLREYSRKLQEWFKTLTPKQQENYCTCNPRKLPFLDAKRMNVYGRQSLKRPSTTDGQKECPTPKPRKRKHDAERLAVNKTQEIMYIPSDSEDEDLEDSSTDEEEDIINYEENEDEEEDEEVDEFLFDMY